MLILIMSAEIFFTSMLCFMSTYDNNLNNMQINSKPLQNVGPSCINEAQSFNEKVVQLLDLQRANDNLFKQIEGDMANLRNFIGMSPNLVNGRSKRETVDTIDILTHTQFVCKIPPKIGMQINNAQLIPNILQCESTKYGYGWILFATLDAHHRNFNEKSTNEFINGFGGFTNGEKVTEYFVGLKRLHEITTEGGEHELLIVIRNVDYWENTHTHYMHYKRFSVAGADHDYRLKSLGEYDGDINDPLQAFLEEPFSLTLLRMERMGTVAMFVRSVNA
ncbi:uncharacterized protein LOC126758796 [Bactrocera neohumeralis]|uniref:uncharacterized protein LOC126758796 n=1 Tax=Bactrocera neohumeralis TaxID=98809 RepID=UPI0021668EE9|nr:uncharacterized protein LOC126758796 [Bactrocera neohumeralis]